MALKKTLGGASVYPPLPTLAELIKKETDKMDAITEAKILAGFDHVVNGKQYHFSYQQSDQINFSQMNSKALLCLSGQLNVPGITDGKIEWRGHADGMSYTLQLTPTEFLMLSAAGGLHAQAMLSAGWDVKNALQACQTEAELNAKVAELDLDAQYRDAQDL